MSRRLFFFVVIVSLFSIGVLVWYFFFTTPKTADTLATTKNALGGDQPPARFGFITQYFNGGDNTGTTTTEVTPAYEQPLLQIWNKPATGQTFVSISFMREVFSTSTGAGTTTITTRKTTRATTTLFMFVDRTT